MKCLFKSFDSRQPIHTALDFASVSFLEMHSTNQIGVDLHECILQVPDNGIRKFLDVGLYLMVTNADNTCFIGYLRSIEYEFGTNPFQIGTLSWTPDLQFLENINVETVVSERKSHIYLSPEMFIKKSALVDADGPKMISDVTTTDAEGNFVDRTRVFEQYGVSHYDFINAPGLTPSKKFANPDAVKDKLDMKFLNDMVAPMLFCDPSGNLIPKAEGEKLIDKILEDKEMKDMKDKGYVKIGIGALPTSGKPNANGVIYSDKLFTVKDGPVSLDGNVIGEYCNGKMYIKENYLKQTEPAFSIRGTINKEGKMNINSFNLTSSDITEPVVQFTAQVATGPEFEAFEKHIKQQAAALVGLSKDELITLSNESFNNVIKHDCSKPIELEEITNEEKWDNRELGASKRHVRVSEDSPQISELISKWRDGSKEPLIPTEPINGWRERDLVKPHYNLDPYAVKAEHTPVKLPEPRHFVDLDLTQLYPSPKMQIFMSFLIDLGVDINLDKPVFDSASKHLVPDVEILNLNDHLLYDFTNPDKSVTEYSLWPCILATLPGQLVKYMYFKVPLGGIRPTELVVDVTNKQIAGYMLPGQFKTSQMNEQSVEGCTVKLIDGVLYDNDEKVDLPYKVNTFDLFDDGTIFASVLVSSIPDAEISTITTAEGNWRFKTNVQFSIKDESKSR